MKKINLLIISIALFLGSCTKKNTYKTPETEMKKQFLVDIIMVQFFDPETDIKGLLQCTLWSNLRWPRKGLIGTPPPLGK